MHRWHIQLVGHPFVTNEYPFWFPSDTDAFAYFDGEACLLTGSAFDEIEDPFEVHQIANRYLDEMYGVILVLNVGAERPRTGLLHRLEPDGSMSSENLAFGGGTIPGRVRDVSVGIQRPADATEGQVLRSAMRGSRNLQLALTILALPHSTWPHLYRCLEEIETYLGTKVSTAGFCSEGERERLTRTANTAETAGVDARHGIGKFRPPSTPMTLTEGKVFVTDMSSKALRRAASAA